MTQQQLENRIKQQDLQIQNLKTAMSRMQKYVQTIERKCARAQESSRTNTEAIHKILRALTDNEI